MRRIAVTEVAHRLFLIVGLCKIAVGLLLAFVGTVIVVVSLLAVALK